MKKIIKTMIMLLCAAMLLSACIPAEYKDGVKLDRDYPDDELPIYDDAVIYECEEDDGEIVVKYGTNDDLDDVIDFYDDFFDDEDIDAEQDEDDDEYAASGVVKNIEFEIEVEQPRDKTLKRAFKTIVEVNIEFVDEEEFIPAATSVPTADENADLLAQLQGFWLAEYFDGEDCNDDGVAFEIVNDTMTIYSDFEYEGIYTITIETDRHFSFIADGENMLMEVEIFDDTMIWTGDDTEIFMSKSTYEEFIEIDGIAPPSSNNTSDYTDFYTPTYETMTDEYLAEAVLGTWHVLYDNTIENNPDIAEYEHYFTHYADGTLTMTYEWLYTDGTSKSGQFSSMWYIEAQIIHYNDSSAYLEIGTDEDSGLYCMYERYPDGVIVVSERYTR